MYADRNALLVTALLDAAPALGGEAAAEARDIALAGATYLMNVAMGTDGAVHHWIDETGSFAPGLLESQMLAAEALLRAGEVTGEGRFREAAERAVAFAEAHLWDPDRGAYRDSPREAGPGWEALYPSSDGALPAGNALAARVHLRLDNRERAARILTQARPEGPARRAHASLAGALLALEPGEGAP